MKKLILVIAMLFMVPIGVNAQQLISVRDSLTWTDSAAVARYNAGDVAFAKDTVTYQIYVGNIDFRADTSMATIFAYKLDTISADTNTVAVWHDSGMVDIIAEFRYLLRRTNARVAPEDTILGNGVSGGQWITIADTVDAYSLWKWKRVKLHPISDYVELRIRDKSTTKKGKDHGKFIEFIWRR